MLFDSPFFPMGPGFFNLPRDPCLQVTEAFPQIGQQFVGLLDVPVQIAQVAFLSPRFHGAGCAAHVDCRNLLLGLPFVGAHIHSLRAFVSFQVFILNHFPTVPPNFAVFGIVPIVHVLPVAHPFAGRKLHSVPIAVQFINFPALGHPSSLLVYRTKRQKDMDVRVAWFFPSS